jgi:hypothetical protein
MSNSNKNSPKRESPRPVQTPASENKYAILQETNGEECQSWYYFIKWNGNEENLRDLETQLEDVEWYILDELSTFDLEIQYLVSERTAKEMTKVDLNSEGFHRKFDGTLRKVDLKFKKKYSDEKKMLKAFDILGHGQIEDYIGDEDIDPEDLVDGSETESDVSLSEEDTSSSEDEKEKPRKKGGLPPGLANNNLPRFAKAKRRPRKHR